MIQQSTALYKSTVLSFYSSYIIHASCMAGADCDAGPGSMHTHLRCLGRLGSGVNRLAAAAAQRTFTSVGSPVPRVDGMGCAKVLSHCTYFRLLCNMFHSVVQPLLCSTIDSLRRQQQQHRLLLWATLVAPSQHVDATVLVRCCTSHTPTELRYLLQYVGNPARRIHERACHAPTHQ